MFGKTKAQPMALDSVMESFPDTPLTYAPGARAREVTIRVSEASLTRATSYFGRRESSTE